MAPKTAVMAVTNWTVWLLTLRRRRVMTSLMLSRAVMIMAVTVTMCGTVLMECSVLTRTGCVTETRTAMMAVMSWTVTTSHPAPMAHALRYVRSNTPAASPTTPPLYVSVLLAMNRLNTRNIVKPRVTQLCC